MDQFSSPQNPISTPNSNSCLSSSSSSSTSLNIDVPEQDNDEDFEEGEEEDNQTPSSDITLLIIKNLKQQLQQPTELKQDLLAQQITEDDDEESKDDEEDENTQILSSDTTLLIIKNLKQQLKMKNDEVWLESHREFDSFSCGSDHYGIASGGDIRSDDVLKHDKKSLKTLTKKLHTLKNDHTPLSNTTRTSLSQFSNYITSSLSKLQVKLLQTHASNVQSSVELLEERERFNGVLFGCYKSVLFVDLDADCGFCNVDSDCIDVVNVDTTTTKMRYKVARVFNTNTSSSSYTALDSLKTHHLPNLFNGFNLTVIIVQVGCSDCSDVVDIVDYLYKIKDDADTKTVITLTCDNSSRVCELTQDAVGFLNESLQQEQAQQSNTTNIWISKVKVEITQPHDSGSTDERIAIKGVCNITFISPTTSLTSDVKGNLNRICISCFDKENSENEGFKNAVILKVGGGDDDIVLVAEAWKDVLDFFTSIMRDNNEGLEGTRDIV